MGRLSNNCLVKYFPSYWKIAQIIMIAKPEKLVEEVSWENIFEKMKPKLGNQRILEHQFEFREKDAITGQRHTVMDITNKRFEYKKY